MAPARLAGVVGLLLATSVGAQAAAGASRPYDIVVIVVAQGSDPATVAVSYPKVVSHAELRAGIEELGRRAGFRPSQVVVRDSPVAKAIPRTATEAEFLAPGLIASRGSLPVGPIIRSLPDWAHMRLVFIVEEEFPFSGPTEVAADGFAVQLASSIGPYEYDVERTDESSPGPEEIAPESGVAGTAEGGEGGAASGAAPVPAGSAGRGRGVLSAALIGMPSGLLVGWLLYGWWERKANRRRARTGPGRGTGREGAGGRASED